MAKSEKAVYIYTDGACKGNPGPGGWGALLSYNGREKELFGGEAETTNNRMELLAAIAALEALEYAVALEVYKESTANTVDVVQAVMQVVENEINQDPLLQGVEMIVWEDQAEQILLGINGLKKAGALGAVLAVFSLYFFLRRLDSTLIVSLSILFSIIAISCRRGWGGTTAIEHRVPVGWWPGTLPAGRRRRILRIGGCRRCPSRIVLGAGIGHLHRRCSARCDLSCSKRSR